MYNCLYLLDDGQEKLAGVPVQNCQIKSIFTCTMQCYASVGTSIVQELLLLGTKVPQLELLFPIDSKSC